MTDDSLVPQDLLPLDTLEQLLQQAREERDLVLCQKIIRHLSAAIDKEQGTVSTAGVVIGGLLAWFISPFLIPLGIWAGLRATKELVRAQVAETDYQRLYVEALGLRTELQQNG